MQRSTERSHQTRGGMTGHWSLNVTRNALPSRLTAAFGIKRAEKQHENKRRALFSKIALAARTVTGSSSAGKR